MKIALIGYGKMGKEIESIALGRGHEIVMKVSSSSGEMNLEELRNADVAIEFSRPDAVVKNIRSCFNADVPVIVGTTGWYDYYRELREVCALENKSMLCASNFSVGVNLFFSLNKTLARLMDPHWQYGVEIHETHHTQKLDAPSGTAITIAEGILQHLERKDRWTKGKTSTDNDLNIFSHRVDNIPGTHSVRYFSEIDDIEITHTAHNRKGFALGAVIAAEWIQGKRGIFSMNDVLGIPQL